MSFCILDDFLAAQRGPDRARCAGRESTGNLPFLDWARITDFNVQSEPIKLRGRQRIGALFQRVLRGEHKKRFGQLECLAACADLRSTIASNSAACVLGGVRLISSASTRFANNGPGKNW